MTDHLSPEIIAAYLDRALDEAKRRSVETHLVECASCRQEIVAVHRASGARARNWRPWAVVPLAAAAAIALVMIVPRDDGGGPPVVRAASDSTDVVQRIDVVLPERGASVSRGRVRFVWRAVSRDVSYRLTLTAADGGRVWSAELLDTTAALPDSVTLQVGSTYLWYVDGMRRDGSQAKTEVRSFTVIP